MSQFILFIDHAGAEFTKARVTRKDVSAMYEWKPIRLHPVDVRPIEVLEDGGAARRAAGGFILLGPLGAALGVMLGKGSKVLFELVMADGSTRRGVITQSDYPQLRKAVAAIQTYKPGQLRKGLATWLAILLMIPICIALGPVGAAVLIGLAIAITSGVERRRRREQEARA